MALDIGAYLFSASEYFSPEGNKLKTPKEWNQGPEYNQCRRGYRRKTTKQTAIKDSGKSRRLRNIFLLLFLPLYGLYTAIQGH